jgi:hypothetical protein
VYAQQKGPSEVLFSFIYVNSGLLGSIPCHETAHFFKCRVNKLHHFEEGTATSTRAQIYTFTAHYNGTYQ